MYAVHVKRTGTKLICDKFRPERRYAVYDREDSMGELLIAVKYGAPLSLSLSLPRNFRPPTTSRKVSRVDCRY